ncbi:hypothetical protein HID58_086273 [Brassica napus]|uniref:Leucine-rich repeat-containing N-terminal plant-type domain-containing protein n=1 Tax=Brassica napus TaxID=3708 RepID=A0ABQ7XRU3_BRANA|nr:hypothetical protein HID58_086273 [Brassica napus]
MKLFLLLSFSALMLLEAYKFTDETDKKSLLEFKAQVSEGRRSVLSSWNNSSPLCNWTGVTCGRKHKRVTGLDIGGLQLGGVISPSIGNLSFLISLNLENNSFGGTIPQEVGNLFRLQHLFMGFNYLEGTIPAGLYNCSRLLTIDLFSNFIGQNVGSEVGSLTELVVLDLGLNKLNGKLPTSLGNLTSLRELGLGDNNIEGGIPDDMARLAQMVNFDLSVNSFSSVFPPVVYNWSSLEYLNIFRNGFSGNLRPTFGNLLPNLRGLYIGNNSLTGAIPTTLPNISTLQDLRMEVNGLVGSIPPGFGKLRNLQSISLHSNFLGSNFSGDLDFLDALTNCTQLQSISVANNTLGGDLPTSISNLSINLMELTLQMNFISGSISRDIGNLISLQSLWRDTIFYRKHYSLYVENNKLSGTLPLEILKIVRLVVLSISDNYLTGFLPKDIGRLENLVMLYVEHNKLSGKLPETLGKCFSMEELQLQGNFFEGTIPDISGLVGVKEVDFSNNYLSGSIPIYFANFNSLENLNLSINNFEGKVPTEGKFKNATIVSVFGNKNLCGGVLELKLSPCLSQELEKRAKHSSLSKKVVTGVGLRCCEESPVSRLAMSEAVKELISIRESFFRSRRRAAR